MAMRIAGQRASPTCLLGRSLSALVEHFVDRYRMPPPICHGAAKKKLSSAAFPTVLEESVAGRGLSTCGADADAMRRFSSSAASPARPESLALQLGQHSGGSFFSHGKEIIVPSGRGVIRPELGHFQSKDGPRLPIVRQVSFYEEEDVYLTPWETPMEQLSFVKSLRSASVNPLLKHVDPQLMMPTKYMRRLWKSAMDLVTINRRRGYCIAKALVEENLVVSLLHGTFALKRAFADHLEDRSNFLAFKAVKRLFLSLMEQRYGPDFISLLMPDILDWLAKLEDPSMLMSDGMIVAEHAWMLPDEGRFWFGVRLAQILTMGMKKDLAKEFFIELYELSIGIDEQHRFFKEWHDHARKVKKTMGPQSAESEGGQHWQQCEGGRWIAMINRHGPLHWRNEKLREIADGKYYLDNVIDLLHFELPTYMPDAQEFFWTKELWHLLDMEQFFPKPVVYPRPQDQMSQESKADPSAFKTYLQLAGTIRKNGFIVIKNRPCKVVAVSTLNHGKCHFVGIDIFNGRKLEDIVPSSHDCDVPCVTRTEFQLIDISEDGYVSLLTESGNIKDDLKLPTDEALQAQIKSGYEEGKDIILTVQAAMGEEQIVTLKEIGGGKN